MGISATRQCVRYHFSLFIMHTWQLMLFTSLNQEVDHFYFFNFWMETRNLSAIVIGKWKAQAKLMTNQRA